MAVVGAGLVMPMAATAARASVGLPEGPLLAFTGLSALKERGFTVQTFEAASMRPRVLVRGSRRGVVPRPFSGVAWSADGSQIAFAASKGKREGIYTVHADGTGLRFLRGTRGGADPVYSPDGSRIAFSREGLEGSLLFSSTPWVARADGGGAHRVAGWRRDTEYVPSSFSPDGSALAVTRTKFASEESRALLIRLSKGGGMRLLARRASEPVFSPDGSQIAFVRHSIERPMKFVVVHRDLYVMSTDGKTSRPLTRTRWVAESHPSWDPSGQRIAFNSFRIGKDPIDALFDQLLPVGNSVVEVNSDGTCRHKVFSLREIAIFGAAWQPGVGREGSRIEC